MSIANKQETIYYVLLFYEVLINKNGCLKVGLMIQNNLRYFNYYSKVLEVIDFLL